MLLTLPQPARAETPPIIDTRSVEAWDQGHLPGGLHTPGGALAERVDDELPAAKDSDRSQAYACRSSQSPKKGSLHVASRA
jgi:rhodanese-related sulfurtransferase